MDYDNIAPPVQYESVWMWILISSLLVLSIYYLVTLLATRKKKALPAVHIDRNSLQFRAVVRNRHMEAISALHKEYLDGNMTAEVLTQRLGVVLRSFAAEYSGMGTRTMTLTEMKRNPIPKNLVDAIEAYYPIAFKNLAESGDPSFAIQKAKDVINTWR